MDPGRGFGFRRGAERITTVRERRPPMDQDTCEFCIDRDLIIAALRQEVGRLKTDNYTYRKRIITVIRLLADEILEIK
jgi:hypothetical protein